MQRLILSGSAIALIAGSLISQDQVFPVGYDSVDGGYYCQVAFRYPAGRYQAMYGGKYGLTTVFSWKAVQWRRSNNNTTGNEERTYQNFQMQIGHWNLVTTDEWASNIGKNPTTVFSGSFTLPGISGSPPAKPSPWGYGDAAGELQCNFASPFLFLSNEGLTVDYTYSGGTLKSGGAWTSDEYYLDGIQDCNMTATASGSTMGNAACPTNYTFQNWLHSDRMPAAKSGDVFRTQIYQYGTAAVANKFHFGVVGTASLANPAQFVSSCNTLYLDLNGPHITYPYMTDGVGNYFSPFYVAPYIAAVVGLDLWAQAAVDLNNKVQLTRADRRTFAAVTTGPYSVAQNVYATNGGSALGGSGYPLGWGPQDTQMQIVKMIQ